MVTTVPEPSRWLTLTPKRYGAIPTARSPDAFAAFVRALDSEADELFDDPRWSHHKEWYKGLVTTSRLPHQRGPAQNGSDQKHHANDKPAAKAGRLSSLWSRGKHSDEHGSAEDSDAAIEWHMRSTIVTEESGAKRAYSYEDFWEALAEDHLDKEREYVSNLSRVVRVGNDNAAFLKLYSLPFPTQNRSFLTYLVVVPKASRKDRAERSFSVYSIPIEIDEDILEEKGYIRGRYVTVERVTELDERDARGNRRIEWKCASMSTPGGSIPIRLAESHADSGLAASVPTFFDWMDKRMQAAPGSTGSGSLKKRLSRQLSRIKSRDVQT